MNDADFGNNSMLDMYLFESTSLLTQLDDILLESEKDSNLTEDNINEIFRIMHTIKGSSAMMEFNTISFVSHKLEDLFYIIREQGISYDYFADLFDLVLKVSDFLKDEVEKIQLNQALSTGNDALVSEITSFLDKLKSGKSSSDEKICSQSETQSQEEVSVLHYDKPEACSPLGPLKYLFSTFMEGCQMENIRAFMLIDKIKPMVNVIGTYPENIDSNPDASSIIINEGFYCAFESNASDEEILKAALTAPSVDTCKFVDSFPNGKSILSLDKSADQQLTPVSTEESAETVNSTQNQSNKSTNTNKVVANSPNANENNSSKENTVSLTKPNLINVDLNKLDTLMDLVSEIVITESMVSGSSDLQGLKLENFDKSSRQLRKLTNELQDIVMSIRMVPIAATFQKMKRIVRDMDKKLNKNVDLVLMGETTEVDKTIIDAIADPLMHLVRNAMDHGMEDKDARAKTSKNPVGRILLSAQNIGGDIIIAVGDDGKGLDTEVLLRKAKEKGLLTKPEAEYSEREIFNLLLLPGFSTKDQVTEFSGRGVGMDVVKKNIEKTGGSVTIESVKGQGTTVYFKIPLTLSIIDSMQIRVGANIYTVPITNIRESFKANSSQLLSDPDGNLMIMIRGVCYPVIQLFKIFNVKDAIHKLEDGILLLVDSGDRLACLLADELIGKHQVVVKPMPTYLGHFVKKDSSHSGISGCTIMGDGSISLILDTQGILEKN